MPELRILLRDLQTGEEGEHVEIVPTARMDDPDEPERWYWTDGNAACGWERLRCLHAAHGRPDPRIECGSSRVIIVRATFDGRALDWGEEGANQRRGRQHLQPPVDREGA